MDSQPRPAREILSQPFTLPNGQEVKNRIVGSAMSEGLAPADNRVPASMAVLYRRWAKGGVGLKVTGNVMVDRRALGEPGNVVLEDDRDLTALRAWASAGQVEGCRIYMQLNHPGRQVPKFLNRESVAPSAVPFSAAMQPFFATPRALSSAEIEGIVERFAHAASLAYRAGFDGAQIHGAHGYLVSQFLSPLTNERQDDWGGSAEKRRRFVVEIYRAMRDATSKDFGISIKINSADFQKGGISPEASTETILALADEGLDFIEVSGGTYEAPAMMSTRESTRRREAYFLEFAQTLRKQLETPLVLTGGFRSGEAMADAIASGAVDMVGLGRTMAVRPDFPRELTTRDEVRCDLEARKTGIKRIDRMGMLELGWYSRQIHRMARGESPDPGEHPLKTLVALGLTQGTKAFRVRRAR
jgi:2,4-dienoyl-CoA reductase-like NADH-dependent reductase (Old Yellow Enzyme family)